jgi:hypothetical protein
VAFAGLPTDTYTINATDPGYVDPNGNATATEAVGVTQSSPASPPALVIGPAGAVKVGFITRGTSVIYDGNTGIAGHGPAPTGGYELSYYGAGGGVNMSSAACLALSGKCTGSGSNPVNFTASPPLAAFAPNNLFPFYLGSSSQYTNNYQVWAGSCEQEQPLQPPAGGFASVMPGKVASTTTPDALVDEPAIDVAVKSGTGTYLPSHVSITFSGKNSAGTAVNCTDTWHQVTQAGTETVSGTPYGTYPAPFASTAAKGSTSPMASNTGDTGTIIVCADYSNNKHASSAALTTTNFTGATMVPVIDVTNGTSGPCP